MWVISYGLQVLFFPPSTLANINYPYLLFLYTFARIITGKCYGISLGAFENAF